MTDDRRPGSELRRVLVLGANGPSGRRTVRQALDRGLQVDALTRHPETFPGQHERLRVVAAMLLDQLDDQRFVRRIVAVATPGLRVKTLQTIKRELLKR